MGASSPFRDAIKEAYGFSEWGERARNVATPLSRGFLPKTEEIAEHELEERVPFPDQRNAFIDYYRGVADPDVRFAVTVVEHATVEQAHEGLVDLLSTCMAPSLPRIEEKGIDAGDVGFAGHGDLQRAAFFARSNILIQVESVGARQISVKGLAELIDQQILAHIKAGER